MKTMTRFKKAILTAFFLFLTVGLWSQEKVIFDTDIGGDVDDLGTMAVLHALANNGEIEILATMECKGRYAAVATLDAVNTFFNRPNIPVGRFDNYGNLPYHASEKHYCEFIEENYPYDVDPNQAPLAADLYRQVLSQQPDNSVIVVSVGGLCNYYDLLQTGGDQYSSLSGKDLFNKKVKRFVVMGGIYDQDNFAGEANFKNSCYSGATQYVFDNVTAPTLFSGMNLGLNAYMTGARISELDDNHIVKAGFKYFTANPPDFMTWINGVPGNTIVDCATFDQCALIGGVRINENYFSITNFGRNDINGGGENVWRTDYDKPHQSYQNVGMDPGTFATTVIEPLMLAVPGQTTDTGSGDSGDTGGSDDTGDTGDTGGNDDSGDTGDTGSGTCGSQISGSLNIEVCSPASNESFAAGSNVTVSVNYTSDITKVHCWYGDGSSDWNWVGEDASAPFELNVNNIPSDIKNVRVRGFNSSGSSTVDKIVTISGSGADDGSTDDGSTDDGSTDDGSTDDGSTDDGSTDDGSSSSNCGTQLSGSLNVEICSPAAGDNITAGTNLTISLNTSSDITNVHCWFADGSSDWNWVGGDNTAPFELTLSNVPSDIKNIRVRGFNSSNTATSDYVLDVSAGGSSDGGSTPDDGGSTDNGGTTDDGGTTDNGGTTDDGGTTDNGGSTDASTITVNARGNCGGETMVLEIDGSDVKTWTNVSNSATDYTYEGYTSGNIKVKFTNDGNNGCDLNLFVDYIKIGDVTYQTESSASRTGCGDGQWLWCEGNFNFGALKNATLQQLTVVENSLRIYPNPASGNFTIQVMENHAMVEIFNYNGQRVAMYQVNNNNLVTVPSGTLKTGLYIIKAGNFVEKLVVQ